jgi:hypothetical protein
MQLGDKESTSKTPVTFHSPKNSRGHAQNGALVVECDPDSRCAHGSGFVMCNVYAHPVRRVNWGAEHKTLELGRAARAADLVMEQE